MPGAWQKGRKETQMAFGLEKEYLARKNLSSYDSSWVRVALIFVMSTNIFKHTLSVTKEFNDMQSKRHFKGFSQFLLPF